MVAGCLVGLVLGLVAGSFIAALTVRWPQGRTVSTGRSQCDACQKVLPPQHLVPILSYLVLRGRCAFCGQEISGKHLMVEIAGGGIGMLSLAVSPDVAGLAGSLFGWGLLALALLDVEHLWLPDAITLPIALLGLAVGAAGVGPPLLDRLIGAGFGCAAFLLIGAVYRRIRGRTGLGQGDAKLMGAIGAWLGWVPLPWVMVIAGLIGAIWIIIARLRGRKLHASSHLPLGAFLAISAWIFWLGEAIAVRLAIPIYL